MFLSNSARKTPKQLSGDEAEHVAETVLRTSGLKTLQRNFRCKLGEIDLIMRDAEHLVFVEVRYRKSEAFGGGLYSVDARKQRKLIRAAQYFLQTQKGLQECPCRFDVVAFEGTPCKENINWIKNAFMVEV